MRSFIIVKVTASTIRTMIIYIGEIRRKATATRESPLISQAHQVLLLFRAIEIIGAAINDTTTGLIPLNILITKGLS